jgi:AcrR family transcriptional regulator
MSRKSNAVATPALPARERLLAAALHLVRTEGMHGLSQGRAASLAGLRQSHLTYYFPTRKDLIKALVHAIHLEMVETMSAPQGGDSVLSVAEVRKFFSTRIRDPLLARLMMALMAAADEDPELGGWLSDFRNEVLSHLRKILKRLGLRPSENELNLFHASIIGLAIIGAQPGSQSASDHAVLLVGLAFDRLVQAARPLPRRTVRHSSRTRS